MASRSLSSSQIARRSPSSWKDIDQSVKPKAMSSVSARRVWVGRAKVAGIVVALVGVLVAALRFSSFLEAGPDLLTRAGETLPIRHVEIATDGSLSRNWVLRALAIEAEANLLSVDLAGMKSKLEAVGQVRAAEIERRFPDTLAVSIEERQPMLRLLAQKSNGERLLLFVDGTGAVFEGEQIDPSVARALPFVEGVGLKRDGQGFAPIAGVEPVARLIEEARTLAPHLYRSWRVISLERSPEIVVKSQGAKEIRFLGAKSYAQQLGRLDYILDHYRSDVSQELASVDLTLNNQVPVKSSRVSR